MSENKDVYEIEAKSSLLFITKKGEPFIEFGEDVFIDEAVVVLDKLNSAHVKKAVSVSIRAVKAYDLLFGDMVLKDCKVVSEWERFVKLKDGKGHNIIVATGFPPLFSEVFGVENEVIVLSAPDSLLKEIAAEKLRYEKGS